MTTGDKQAFPRAGFEGEKVLEYGADGMTYREWAAALCLAALAPHFGVEQADSAADLAVRHTDALIKRLNAPEDK